MVLPKLTVRLAQLDRKIAKKLKSMNTPKDVPRRVELVAPPSEESEPSDRQRTNELNELKELVKGAIDAEFQKFIERPCKFLN